MFFWISLKHQDHFYIMSKFNLREKKWVLPKVEPELRARLKYWTLWFQISLSSPLFIIKLVYLGVESSMQCQVRQVSMLSCLPLRIVGSVQVKCFLEKDKEHLPLYLVIFLAKTLNQQSILGFQWLSKSYFPYSKNKISLLHSRKPTFFLSKVSENKMSDVFSFGWEGISLL